LRKNHLGYRREVSVSRCSAALGLVLVALQPCLSRFYLPLVRRAVFICV